MKKYLLFVGVLFCFAFINHSLAAGKVLPFNWDKPVFDPGEQMVACPIEDIDVSQPKPTVTGITGLLKIVRADGRIEYFDNRSGQLKNNYVELKINDQIITSGGHATLNFSDGSSLSLYSNTTVVYGERENIVKVKLLLGRMRVLLPSSLLKPLRDKVTAKLESKMRVSAACVRGTDFVMEQTEDENISKYYLYEGTLDIVNLSGELKQLDPGDIATVNGNGEITIEKLEQEKWDQMIGEIKQAETSEKINEVATTEQEVTKDSSNKWFALIAVIVIGAGLVIYRKKA